MSINVTLKVHFPQMKPAHHADICKHGAGSNLDRAVRDAITNVFHDERVKGKSRNNVEIFKITGSIFQKIQETDDE